MEGAAGDGGAGESGGAGRVGARGLVWGGRAWDGTHSRVHQLPDAPERAGDGLGVPVRPPRACCPPGCSVDDNGVEFPVGQLWSPGDPCELCICQVNENLLRFPPLPAPGTPRTAPDPPPRPRARRAAAGRGSPASWAGDPLSHAVGGAARGLRQGLLGCRRTAR